MLIDIRTEVEKWADNPVEVRHTLAPIRKLTTLPQFHFAPILSPWIRRALVAGGFGIGIPNPGVTPDLASIVSYHESRLSSQSIKDDLEAMGDGKKRPSRTVELEPVVSLDTPFFHLDLGTAVRAAESAARRATPLI